MNKLHHGQRIFRVLDKSITHVVSNESATVDIQEVFDKSMCATKGAAETVYITCYVNKIEGERIYYRSR